MEDEIMGRENKIEWMMVIEMIRERKQGEE